MEDIAPQLIESVKAELTSAYEKSGRIRKLLDAVKRGTATYEEAQQYAIEVSRLIGQAYEMHISSAVLPDGKLYYNIASRLIPETLDENYTLVADYAKQVQQSLNKQAGLGLKPQAAAWNEDRTEGLVELAVSGEAYDQVSAKLRSAFETYSQSIVDETIRTNVDFHGRAGLHPKVIRRTTGRCCDWCRALAGVHDYPVDREVYRRHENCRCTVLYDPGDGRRQDVYTKRWTNPDDRVRINLKRISGIISESGKRYEPEIFIPVGVGAKQRDISVRLPNGERVKLTPGSRITHVETIAGLGRNRKIDMIDLLMSRYPDSDALKWQKKKGMGFIDLEGESYRVELHWYEEPSVGKVDFKIKPDADGNWFYED